jgi:hypothetical protein
MIEAKIHASKNTLYFHSVVEIPRRNYGVLAHLSGPSPNLGQEIFLYWDRSFVNRGVAVNHVL